MWNAQEREYRIQSPADVGRGVGVVNPIAIQIEKARSRGETGSTHTRCSHAFSLHDGTSSPGFPRVDH